MTNQYQEEAERLASEGVPRGKRMVPWLVSVLSLAHAKGREEGLREAEETGPSMMLFGGGSKTCELHKDYKCGECEWWNDALTVKNDAIRSLRSPDVK